MPFVLVLCVPVNLCYCVRVCSHLIVLSQTEREAGSLSDRDAPCFFRAVACICFGLIFFLDGTWRTKCKELLKFGGMFVFLNFVYPVMQWPNALRWPALVLRIQGFSSGKDQVGMRSNDFDIRSRSDLQALRTAFHRPRFLSELQFRMLVLICIAIVAVVCLKIVLSS